MVGLLSPEHPSMPIMEFLDNLCVSGMPHSSHASGVILCVWWCV